MGIDFGQALAAGIASGAGAVENQWQQQNANDMWLQREQQLQTMQEKNWRQHQQYLEAIKAPEVDKQTVTDPTTGRPMIQNRQWVPPTEDEIAAGKKGHFEVTSTEAVPRKLGQRTYQSGGNEVTELYDTDTGETVRQMGQGPKWDPEQRAIEQARLGIDAGRLQLDKDKAARDAKTGKDYTFSDYANASPEQQALYDRYRRGEATPTEQRDLKVREAVLKWQQENPDAGPEKVGEVTAQYQAAMGADPLSGIKNAVSNAIGLGAKPKPMGQFAGPSQPSASSPKAQKPPPDGTIKYDAQGRKYVVKNGVPVLVQ